MKWMLIGLLCVAGCAHSTGSRGMPAAAVYSVVADGGEAGDYSVEPGLNVSAAVRLACGRTGRRGPMTVIYVRRGPEGMTRHLVDLDGGLMAKNPQEDVVLRDGDQLILPATYHAAKPQ